MLLESLVEYEWKRHHWQSQTYMDMMDELPDPPTPPPAACAWVSVLVSSWPLREYFQLGSIAHGSRGSSFCVKPRYKRSQPSGSSIVRLGPAERRQRVKMWGLSGSCWICPLTLVVVVMLLSASEGKTDRTSPDECPLSSRVLIQRRIERKLKLKLQIVDWRSFFCCY